MRNFDLRKLQLCELTILEEVDRICKTHDLKYYLAWGSALGARRHQGFIPWDDDIDVCMPWNDYWKFKEVCKTGLDDKFFYEDNFIHNDYYLYWAKIRKNNTTSMTVCEKDLKIHWGICIDIFPLIPLKEKSLPILHKAAYLLLKFLCNRSFIQCKGYPTSMNRRIKKFAYIFFPEKLARELKKECFTALGKYKDEANYYLEISEGYHREILKKEVFGEGTDMLFENKLFKVPDDIDAYLHFAYGENYMVIPKEHERIDHGDIIVDFTKNYTEYQ